MTSGRRARARAQAVAVPAAGSRPALLLAQLGSRPPGRSGTDGPGTGVTVAAAGAEAKLRPGKRRQRREHPGRGGGEKMASEMEPEVQAIDRSLLECSAEEIAGKWLQATDLTREVYQHLAHCVPKIYCRGPNPFPQKEDTLAQHILLGPMEWYICGEDPALGFPKLEQANKPSHLCGRVFKVGEPTYSCRDCAVDPTCVLCMECFLGSIHRDHRYRMTTSGGGGFCDCGDTEAWKEGPYCQRHELSSSEVVEEEDPLVHLSEDVIARTYNIFAIMFRYAVDILTWETESELPEDLDVA